MIHPHTELRFAGAEVGYGVFATHPIPRGTLLWTLCWFDQVYPPAAAATLPGPYREILGRYGYVEASGNYVLCWDHARYLNHSCAPAMLGVGREFEIAVRDLAPGDEVTCDYGGLNLTSPLECRCGAPTCRGRIDGDDVLHRWRDWDALVAVTLPAAAAVPQPLLPYARDAVLFADYVAGRRPVPSHRDYRGIGVATSAGDADAGLPWALPAAAGAESK